MGQRRCDGLPPTPEPVSGGGKSMPASYGNHLAQKVIMPQRGRQITTLPWTVKAFGSELAQESCHSSLE